MKLASFRGSLSYLLHVNEINLKRDLRIRGGLVGRRKTFGNDRFNLIFRHGSLRVRAVEDHDVDLAMVGV